MRSGYGKGGIVIIAAATCQAFYSKPSQKEVISQGTSNKVTENQRSELMEGEALVLSTNQVPITLVDIIDGDTIKIRVNGKVETVRYLLVDTPESKNPKTCIQHFAMEAFFRNNELVKSGVLTMELEQGSTRDSFGRLLAYVYVDGKLIQETLLKEGYARLGYILDPPYKYLDPFKKDENLAKRNKRNIWSVPNFVTKWGFNGCLHR
ncbi:thermonuclease family protein [Neobacillus sp. K501]